MLHRGHGQQYFYLMEKRESLFTHDGHTHITPAFLEAILNATDASVELLEPIWEDGNIIGFMYKTLQNGDPENQGNGLENKNSLLENKDDDERFQKMKEAVKDGKPAEAIVSKKVDGDIKRFNEHYISFGNDLLVVRRQVDATPGVVSKKNSAAALTDEVNSLERSHRILNTINEACFELDKNGTVVFVNRQALEWWGLKKEEVIGRNIWEVFPESVSTFWYDLIQVSALEKHQYSQHQYVSAVLKSWISLSATPTPTGCIVVFHDVDKGKKAEQEIIRLKEEIAKEASDKYNTLFTSIDQGFCIITLKYDKDDRPVDYRFIEVSPSFEHQTGIKDATGRWMRDIAADQDEYWFEVFGRVAKNRKPERFENFSTPFGRWLNVYAFPLDYPELRRIGVLLYDITGRKKADEALRASEEKYRSIVEGMDEALALCEGVRDAHGHVIDYRWLEVNGAKERLIGLSRDEMIGKLRSQSTLPPDPEAMQLFQAVLDTGQAVHTERRSRATGRWVNFTAFPLSGDRFVILGYDITQRKIAEENKAYIQMLSDVLRSETDPLNIEEQVSQVAMQYFASDRCYYCTIEGDNAIIRIDSMRGDLPSVAGIYSLGRFLIFKKVLEGGRPFIVHDAHTSGILDEELRQLCIQLKVISFIDVPIIKNGKAVGIFCLVQSEPRQWTDWEIELANETAGRTWFALEKAKAEELLRFSEERLRSFNINLEQQVTQRTHELKISSEKIKEDAHFINQILETTPDIVYIMDLNTHQIIYANRQVAAHLGYTREQIMQMKNPVLDIMHPDDIDRFKDHLKKIKTLSSDDKVLEIEYRLKTAKDQIRWFCDRNSVFKRNSRKIPVEKIGFCQNITERKQREEQAATGLKILKQAEEVSGMGTWEYDIATADFKWSDGMYELFKVPRNMVPEAETYFDYTPESERPVIEKIVENITVEYQPFEEIITLLPENGPPKKVRIKAIVMHDAKKQPAKIIGVDLDITEQIKAADAIKDLNRDLLARNNELQSLNAELKTFNTITASDYKETLQILYTNLEYIASHDGRRLGDTSKANIRRAQSAIQRMKLLTDDINRYLQLYEIGISKSLIDPNIIIDNLISSSQKKIEQQSASFQLSVLPALYADPYLFSQLIAQLIDNSLKFRKLSSPPVIRIRYSRADEMNAVPAALKNIPYTIISVNDNGLGFRDEVGEKIFELFFRATESKIKGSGIGLAACKKIMAMHNGFITAESIPGTGSTFNCYFPDQH